MNRVTARVKAFFQDEQGASAAEFGVLTALIVLVCTLALSPAGVEFAGAMGGRP